MGRYMMGLFHGILAQPYRQASWTYKRTNTVWNSLLTTMMTAGWQQLADALSLAQKSYLSKCHNCGLFPHCLRFCSQTHTVGLNTHTVNVHRWNVIDNPAILQLGESPSSCSRNGVWITQNLVFISSNIYLGFVDLWYTAILRYFVTEDASTIWVLEGPMHDELTFQ